MDFTEINFKHFIIDEGDVEKLIDMWKHFYKKDDPYPLPNGCIFINAKNPEVDKHGLMFNLVYLVGQLPAPIDRWYRSSLQYRMERPVPALYKLFIKRHRTDLEPKVEDIPDDAPKKRKKKE